MCFLFLLFLFILSLRVILSFHIDLTRKTSIHLSDYPCNNLANHKEYVCYSSKLESKGVTLTHHMDYPCILLFVYCYHNYHRVIDFYIIYKFII
ncbi:hypothetical protein Hanom_Chr15g01393381 [Helianthus anomalus]